jgi:integrase
VTTVRLRYTVRKRGKLFWQPTPEMKALGFMPKSLGDDGPAAHAEALKLAAAWDQAKANRGKVTDYPAGSFGAYFDRFKRTKTWAKKAPRTREDYERAWKHMDSWRPKPDRPTLSRTEILKITPELCEEFADHLERTLSPNERHRTVKWFKVLMQDANVRLQLRPVSVAAVLKNPQPRGRTAIWLHAEIEDLAAVAAIAGFEGMSLAIRLAWETMFSPVDIWTLRPRELAQDGSGWFVRHSRAKTGKEAYAALSEALAADLAEYLADQGRAEADETPILRQRDGNAYRSKDTFGDDFRAVRAIAFPGDTRQFLDIRRSANVEADAAGADKRTMGELLANGLADSRFLEETYTPPTVAKARDVAAQRVAGRAKLAGEVARLRSAN